MTVTTASLTKHFKDNGKTYGIVLGTSILSAAFGAAASEYFEYGRTAANTLVGAGSGLLLGCALALNYNAEH